MDKGCGVRDEAPDYYCTPQSLVKHGRIYVLGTPRYQEPFEILCRKCDYLAAPLSLFCFLHGVMSDPECDAPYEMQCMACDRRAAIGSDVCRYHGGAAPR